MQVSGEVVASRDILSVPTGYPRGEPCALLGHEALDVGQDLLGRLHRHRARLQIVEQPRRRVCMLRTKSFMLSREPRRAGVISTSMPGSTIPESPSVTTTATSMKASRLSRPVISQSIQTKGSFRVFHAFYGSALWVIRLGGSRSLMATTTLGYWKGS